jgi:adenosylcobyric acid synthase
MTGKGSCIAVFGTGSDVGKSVVAAALCRIFNDFGFKVAPFKTQNMSNNSYVTGEGGEIGRAQVVQAECARIEPHVDMNPLLLKPSANCRSQMVLHGKAAGEVSSGDFRTDRSKIFEMLMESLERLRSDYELVVIEGAGSCAEVNLRDYDIANFRTAKRCGAPVLLVADIDRGGVFAQVTGTLGLLEPGERNLVKGIIINRFRGDPKLFEDGITFLEKRTRLPVLGVVPYFETIEIDPEDSLPLENVKDPLSVLRDGMINVAVVRLPHISNFTDFLPMSREPSVNLTYLTCPVSLNGLDLLILPGTKNVLSDLGWLEKTGWAEEIKRYADNSGKVCGICGGYQMLGKTVSDPHAVEGGGKADGLGLLDVSTELQKEKRLMRVKGIWKENKIPVSGYEIHMGTTRTGKNEKPVVEIIGGHGDGARSANGNVWGTYLHGIFDTARFRNFYLRKISPAIEPRLTEDIDAYGYRQRQYDLLADHFRAHLDVAAIARIAGMKKFIAGKTGSLSG